MQVCVGYTTALADVTPGGTWSSSNAAVAGVDPAGTVTGAAAGTATISYSAAGCAATAVVTVSIPPATISGLSSVCQGSSTTFTDAVPGGSWTSSDPTIAAAGLTTGIITGVNPGVATITYSVGAGCSIPKNITVNLTPVPISGPAQVCATQTITLTDGTGGGAWSSATPTIATISASTGVLTGVAAGTVIISYTLGGCPALTIITVNPMPAPIGGNTNVCLGGTSTLTDAVSGGTWTSAVPSVATIGSSSGVVFGAALGTSTIIYMLPAGCVQSTTVHVYPLPLVFNVTGGGSYCAGGNGVHIGLNGSTVGINYLLYRGTTATGTFAGTGSPLDFGLQTVGGTYTVEATATVSGCTIAMAGIATVSVTPTVTPSLTLSATPNDTVCTGTTVTFVPVPVNGGTAPVYQWSVNGTNVATTGTYTYIPANGDAVEAIMTSNANCPAPLTGSVTVTMRVEPFAHPSVSLSATPGDTVCQGTVVTVTPVPTYGGNSPAYTWLKNGVISGTGGGFVFAPDNNDQVYCIMASDYLCQLSNPDTSAVMVMTTDTPLTPVVTISANPGTMISRGQSVTLTATVVNGGTAPTYQWVKNSIPVTGATNASYTSDSFSYPTDDSIACLVTSNAICPATGFKWVYIQVAQVGVRNVTAGESISIVPNPNKGDFTIKGNVGSAADQEVNLEITDVLGQVVYTGKLMARSGRLNNNIQLSSNLANGMYLLTLRSDAGSIVVHLIIGQ